MPAAGSGMTIDGNDFFADYIKARASVFLRRIVGRIFVHRVRRADTREQNGHGFVVIAKCGGLKHGPDPVNSMMMRRDFRSGRQLEQLGIDTRLGGIAENGDHLDSGLPDPAAPPVGWRADSSVGVFA
jgi:hypothetical protein